MLANNTKNAAKAIGDFFIMTELEKDTQEKEKKPTFMVAQGPPQMPNMKPVFDLLKIPVGAAKPQQQNSVVAKRNNS